MINWILWAAIWFLLGVAVALLIVKIVWAREGID